MTSTPGCLVKLKISSILSYQQQLSVSSEKVLQKNCVHWSPQKYLLHPGIRCYTVWDNLGLKATLNFPTGQGFKTLTWRELCTSLLWKVKLKYLALHNRELKTSTQVKVKYLEKTFMEVYTSHLSKVKYFIKTLTCMEVYTSHQCKVKYFNRTLTCMEVSQFYD